MKQSEPSLAEQKRDLKEAIRVNEGLLCEQQAHISMHASRIEALEWQLEETKQRIDRQHSRRVHAPGRVAAIQATLESQRVALAALEVEAVAKSSKVTMKQLCELLGQLMASPATQEQGKLLLKGINQGVSHEELWTKYSGVKA